MPITISHRKTSFWVICCDESKAARQVAAAIESWQFPGVRVHVGAELPLTITAAIAQADHSLFIAEAPSHSSNLAALSIQPLSRSTDDQATAPQPAALLSSIYHRHRRVPQAWWTQADPRRLTSAAALNDLKDFLRPYAFGPLASATASTHKPSGQSNRPVQWQNCRKPYRI